MTHHAAYNRPLESLDVVVVEDSRHMQTILRSMLGGIGVQRLRVYDRADLALKEMVIEPPHLVLSDWQMAPMSGYRLLRSLRHRRMLPLCFVPFVMVTAHATRTLVERAMHAGAHQLVVKPFSPATLAARLAWLTRDARTFRLAGEHYEIEGVEDMLEMARLKNEMHAMLAEGQRAKARRTAARLPDG